MNKEMITGIEYRHGAQWPWKRQSAFPRRSVGTRWRHVGSVGRYPGSHAPAWEPIPELGSATVCIPTQERGNEAALGNGLPLDAASPWLTCEIGGFSLPGAVPAYGGGKPSTAGCTRRIFSGSHAPAWEPIPELGSATVCIPTQERGNEAALGNGLSLDTASPWLTGEIGGFAAGGGKPFNARFFP
jgi:hypothetical protein